MDGTLPPQPYLRLPVSLPPRRPRYASHFGVGWALFRDSFDSPSSRVHHALKICLMSDPNIMVDLGESTIWTSAVLLGSGARYHIQHNKGLMCSLYLDLDCEAAAGLAKLYGNFRAISLTGAVERAARKCVRRIIDNSANAERTFEEFSMFLGGQKTARVCDPKVMVALAELVDCYRNRYPLAGLAQTAGLSPGRFATLFKASTGFPVRTYVRWLRTQTAVRALAMGADQASAAKAAGYSSPLLFARSFRLLFGVSPSVFAATLRN
jgi:AraC-like DNA-binding protein